MKENVIEYNRADHWRGILGIQVPDNIALFASERYCNIQLNICSVDVEGGYGNRVTKHLSIMLPYEKCSRCGYHSLFNPDDSKSRCMRHTLTRGWDTVFTYEFGSPITLERSFQIFLDKQPSALNMPVICHRQLIG